MVRRSTMGRQMRLNPPKRGAACDTRLERVLYTRHARGELVVVRTECYLANLGGKCGSLQQHGVPCLGDSGRKFQQWVELLHVSCTLPHGQSDVEADDCAVRERITVAL